MGDENGNGQSWNYTIGVDFSLQETDEGNGRLNPRHQKEDSDTYRTQAMPYCRPKNNGIAEYLSNTGAGDIS